MTPAIGGGGQTDGAGRQKLITDILIKGHPNVAQNTTWRFVQRETQIKIASEIYFPHKNAVDPPIIYVTASGRLPMHYWVLFW